MANVAAQLVLAYLESKNIHASKEDDNTLTTGFSFDGGRIDILISFDEDGTHVSIEGINFLKVPENKYDSMYKVLNSLNTNYKHFKFYLYEDAGQVFVRDEDIIQLDSCGDECYELLVSMVSVVEAVYPELMKAIWA